MVSPYLCIHLLLIWIWRVQKCNDVMGKSERVWPWKDHASCFCRSLVFRSSHALLTHRRRPQSCSESPLLLTLIARLHSVKAVVQSHAGACVLTEDSSHLPYVSQSWPYMVRVINALHMFYHKPSSKHSHPLCSYWRHKTEGWKFLLVHFSQISPHTAALSSQIAWCGYCPWKAFKLEPKLVFMDGFSSQSSWQ